MHAPFGATKFGKYYITGMLLICGLNLPVSKLSSFMLLLPGEDGETVEICMAQGRTEILAKC